jgi:putative transposase
MDAQKPSDTRDDFLSPPSPASQTASRKRREPRYHSGGHTKHRLLYHVVINPKYRKRVLEGAILGRIEQLFRECCEVNDWSLEEMNVQSDHVHLLLQLPPTMSVSAALNKLKGVSSRLIRLEFKDELLEHLWGSQFWSDGYFAESVGRKSEASVRRYVREQDKKHGGEAKPPRRSAR